MLFQKRTDMLQFLETCNRLFFAINLLSTTKSRSPGKLYQSITIIRKITLEEN